MSGFSKLSDRCLISHYTTVFFLICWVHTLHNISLGRISNKAYHLQNACMRSDAENDDLKFPLLSHWLSVVADFQSKHAARL